MGLGSTYQAWDGQHGPKSFLHPPPSTMSYPLGQEPTTVTVQVLQQELANTHKKLQEYADTIVSLHTELRTLRDGICGSCKRKFLPANLASSQAAVDSPSFLNRISPSRGPAEHSDSTPSWRRLLKGHHHSTRYSSGAITSGIHNSHISQKMPSKLSRFFPFLSTPTPPTLRPIMHENEQPTPFSYPRAIASSDVATAPKIVPCDRRWYAERNVTASVLNVNFASAFIHTDTIQSICFSSDGKYLAVALEENQLNNGMVVVYDVGTGTKFCTLLEYASQYSSKTRPCIYCMCFSPNGKYLAVGDGADRIIVWDIPKKRMRNIFRGHSLYVRSIHFSPNNQHVVSASWYNIIVWNMRDGSARDFTDHHAYTYSSVRFSPNGRFIATGYSNGTLKIWDLRTGRLVMRWTGHACVERVVFMQDGKGLISSGDDGVVEYWDVSSLGMVQPGQVPPQIVEFSSHTENTLSVGVSPDAQWVASTSEDGTAILWDIRTGVRQYTLFGHRGSVNSCDFSPAGTYFATGSVDGYVTLWSYTNFE